MQQNIPSKSDSRAFRAEISKRARDARKPTQLRAFYAQIIFDTKNSPTSYEVGERFFA